MGIDLLMTALAEAKKLLTKLLIGVCRRHTASVMLQLARTYGQCTHTWRRALKAQRTQVALASTQPIPTELAFAVHSTNLLQQTERWLHIALSLYPKL